MKRQHKDPSASLAARVSELEARLIRLEAARGMPPSPARSTPPPVDDPTDEPGRAAMALLDDLSRREGARWYEGTTGGALGYAGWVRVDDRRYAWARETAVPELRRIEPGELARWLTGIASPQRVALLLELFGRDRTSSELSAALGDASTGQVYHHLKELQAAGIVLQVSRGVYRIAPHLLVPLLVILSAVAEGVQARSGEALEPFPAKRTQPPESGR